MKTKRQEKIIDIVTKNEIGTQEALIDALRAAGCNVTQATVSRDIRELKLLKVPLIESLSRLTSVTDVSYIFKLQPV